MIVAFDYDGVIVDSLDANIEMMNQILCDLGIAPTITRETFHQLKVISFDAIGECITLSKEEMDRFLQMVSERNHSIQDSTPLFPGVEQLFRSIHQHCGIYIVSNNETSLVTSVLEQYGLLDLVDGIAGPELGESKSQRLKELKGKSSEVYFIGDGVSDITEGNKAQVYTIAVGWGFQPLEVLDPYGPTSSVSTLKELEDLLLTAP